MYELFKILFGKKARKTVRMARNGIVFLDDLYQATGRLSGKGTREEMIRAAHEILDELEG